MSEDRKVTAIRTPGTRERDAAEVLRATLGSAPCALVVVDREGRIRGGWNQRAEAMLGWSFDEVKHRVLDTLIDARDDAGLPVAMGPGGEDPPELSRITVSDRYGTAIPVQVTSGLFRDASGGVTGAVLFLEDLSEREALESQLKQAQKLEAVGQLTGGIAHDFNNLLTIVQTNAELLGDRVEDLPGVAEHLADIQTAVDRGSALVRRLMAFGRNDPTRTEVLDLGALVTSYAATLERVLPDHIQVETTVGAQVPAVRADAGALQQILLNLATNAKDAMPEGGRLTLQVVRATHAQDEPEGDWVCLSVEDTGIGIDPEALDQIFEPFYTTKPIEQGTGLGLSMVRELARGLGGSVRVRSTPGSGTEFRIYLPPADATGLESADQPEHAAAAAPDEAKRCTGTILVVEDDHSVRKVIRRALSGVGYDVIATADGAQAVEAFEAHPEGVDLVVSDLVMPNMDGASLYHALNPGEQESVPFLFISGYSHQDVRIEALLEQGVPVLQKPWSVGQLCEAVQDARNGAA